MRVIGTYYGKHYYDCSKTYKANPVSTVQAHCPSSQDAKYAKYSRAAKYSLRSVYVEMTANKIVELSSVRLSLIAHLRFSRGKIRKGRCCRVTEETTQQGPTQNPCSLRIPLKHGVKLTPLSHLPFIITLGSPRPRPEDLKTILKP